jgi:hypothetical protein
MSFEKPISTIRKAIEGTAEKIAFNENLENPDSKHFEYVIKLYKHVRMSNPQMLEKIIRVASNNKELKEDIG